jgi:hypothetical protein
MPTKKHFAIICTTELTDASMVGTLTPVYDIPHEIEALRERVLHALQEYFDTDDLVVPELPDLFCGQGMDELTVVANGIEETIAIYETWLF